MFDAPALALLEINAPVIQITGFFYQVIFDETEMSHHIFDGICSCKLGADCPAVDAVETYLFNGGDPAPDPPDGYFPFVPDVCPVCGEKVFFEPSLSSRNRGSGWRCAAGGAAHYWRDQGEALQRKATGHTTCDCDAYPFLHRRGTGLCLVAPTGFVEDQPIPIDISLPSPNWLPLEIMKA